MNVTSDKLIQRKIDENIVKFIWHKKCPPRVALLAWFLVQEQIKCGSYLHNLGLLIVVKLDVVFVL